MIVMNKIRLIVTCTFGLEAVVKQELISLGFCRFIVLDGKIEFDAELNDVPKLNLWLRTADRVFIKIAEFKAVDFDVLFDKAKACPWSSWITEDGKITVTGKSVKSVLQSVRSNQSIVKKAIIKKMQESFNRERFPETGPEFIIQVSIFKDMVQLALDTTGSGLHRRNYRVDTGEVPIKENLAAALVLLSSWHKDKVLIDPMCGSATILIEAAMIGRNIAPGLKRNFVSEDWPFIDKKFWEDARNSALDKMLPSGSLQIFGYDIDRERIEGCERNAKNAGVENDIVFKAQDIKDLRLGSGRGVVISNPPYGVKMGAGSDLNYIYSSLSKAFKNKTGWGAFIITADKSFPKYFSNGKPDKMRKLYNGTIETNYYQYKNK